MKGVLDEVRYARYKIKFDCGEKVINRGDKFQITASFTPSNTTNKDLTWETDNELVASVSENGEVKGINAGTAVITAKTANGIQALCTVEVKVPAKKIKLNVTELQMNKGEKKEIRASMTPLDTTDTITWMSSNSKVYSTEEIALLLNYLHDNGVSKLRNYTIAVLIAVYGYRASDIAALKLSDIDWDNGKVCIIQEKASVRLTHDLTSFCGNALADYLLKERPVSSSSFVFIKADGSPITPTGVS